MQTDLAPPRHRSGTGSRFRRCGGHRLWSTPAAAVALVLVAVLGLASDESERAGDPVEVRDIAAAQRLAGTELARESERADARRHEALRVRAEPSGAAPADPLAVPELPPRAIVTGPLRDRGIEALEQLSYPWRALDWTIEFHGPRDGLMGMTYPHERRIEVYLRPDQPIESVAVVVAHEIGHAVDITHNDDERRIRWQQLRGYPADVEWFGCDGCSDYDTGAGDYAEVFAWWQTGGRDYRSTLAPPPDEDQLGALLPLFHP